MKRNPPQKIRRLGFTLTEVLLVLAILGVIAAMVVPNLMARQQEAYGRQTKANIAALEQCAKQYAVAHDGELPKDIATMMNPGQDASGKPLAPFIDKMPKDAWGQPLIYEFPSGKMGGNDSKPAIWSSGKNKQNEDGGGDDVNNWTD